mgnify:CR=1 FL=1
MRFTNNPYEGFMKEKSYFKGVPPSLPPKGSRCDGCPYWRGIGCVFCYREQLKPPGNGSDAVGRELTRTEKAAIRRLVSKWCANYDRDCGCLPLDCECYMFGKCWTGAYCRYFREAVLPLDPALEAALLAEGSRPDFKACPVCGRAVAPDGRQTYCSAACAKAAHRRQQREYMRKKRG